MKPLKDGSFKHETHHEDAILKGASTVAESKELGNEELGRLRFARARLATYDTALP
jgi:hypothetical protein